MQEIIHLLLRLVEPKLVPFSSPESLEFFTTDQMSIKAGYLYIFNTGFAKATSIRN